MPGPHLTLVEPATSDSESFDHAGPLIEAFKHADLNLRLAIERDESEKIGRYGNKVDQLADMMLSLTPSSKSEALTLYRFLVDRFVLRDETSAELRKKICDRLLALI